MHNRCSTNEGNNGRKLSAELPYSLFPMQAEAKRLAEQSRGLEDARGRLTEELARREASLQQKEADATQEAKRSEGACSRAHAQLEQVQH